MKSTLFYINDKVQVQTDGPAGQSLGELPQDWANAQFFINGQELVGNLEFCTHEENKKVVSVVVKTYIRGVRGETPAIEFQQLDKMLHEIQLAYKGISEILGNAFLNGYFKKYR